MERKYIAFISYKHAERDAAIAKQVHTLIENYVIPKSLRKDSRKLGIVFRDEEELPISSDLTESICTALDASRYLIVICSPEAKESPWVAREVNYFLKNHDSSNAFVVLANGEPNDVFPYELTHILNEETGEYQEVEPLAMDVRADSIGASLKKAKANIKKLYAGMLVCSYDSLVQREKMRRMKRFVALAALCAILVGSFIGMLFVKNQELSQKNDELTAAIELALKRESELLVEQAEEAIQEKDMVAAIKYASDALYSEEVDRPYYAAAERALFSAMDVLQAEIDGPLLTKVELKHHSPIEMMTYCAGGASICTIDAYGTVNCYDTASGDMLWNVKIREHSADYNTPVATQIWYDGENNIIVCYYDDVLSGLNASTGELSWQTELKNNIECGLFFDEVGKQLAYVEREYFPNLEDYLQAYYEYNFIVLSTRDGSVLHKVPFERLTENANNFDKACFGKRGDCHSTGMFIGSDGFAGTVFRSEEGVDKAFFYTVDLTKDTVIFVENEAVENTLGYMRTICAGDDRALVLREASYSDVETLTFEQNLFLQCFDVKTGTVLWESRIQMEDYIPADSNCFVVPQTESMVLAVGNSMYVVENETGEIETSTKLKAEVIEMHSIVDGLFGYTLADGYYAVGWSNQYGLHDSNFYSATVDLPDTSKVVHYNGGMLQAYFTGNNIDGFSILPIQDGGGSMTYLSQDRCTAYVASALPGMKLPDPIPIDTGDVSTVGMGEFIDMTPDGKVLMGPTSLPEGYGLSILDTANHTFETYAMEDSINLFSLSNKDVYLTGDGQKILICEKDGGIQSVGLDGSISVIAEREEVVLQTVGQTNYIATIHRADAARQASDGRILTARSDGKNLEFWMDGGEETSVPLPENVFWALENGLELYSMLHVGENGLVVLSDFASEDAAEIEHFVVYDLASQKWKQIPDAAHGSHKRQIVFGQNSPVFAVYDEDMNIRVYDWNSAEPVHCINAGLPMVSVQKIGMMMDDRYVYVLTEDGRFMIYSIETSEMVFRTIFRYAYSAAYFSNWLDRANERLYLRMDANALCVDMRTWEQLFNAKDFKFYSPAQNEVYVSTLDMDTLAYSLKAIPIPSTSELVDIVQNTLHWNE